VNLKAQIDEAVAYVRDRCPITPDIAIVTGTGLGALANEVRAQASIPYGEIPHFPVSSAPTHAGELVLGELGGKKVAILSGRVHYYEGYTMQQVTFPIRVVRGLGASVLILSNAVGGMNPMLQPGDIVIITDHINLMGDNPLIGPNEDDLGPRFPDMVEAYNRNLITLVEDVGVEERIRVRRGVYVAVAGPNLETAAEYRFLRTIGADVVGMSIVPETIVAVHGGMRVLGLSVVTDKALPDALGPANIDEILRVAAEAEPRLTRVVRRVVELTEIQEAART
jgi:purine-nucleoside phosphorylase